MVVVLRLGVLVPFCEEFVAGGAEALPQLVSLLVGDGAYLLPLLLQLDELVRCLLPFSAGLEGLCLLNYLDLLCKVLYHTALVVYVEVTLLEVEAVAGCAEAVVDLLVVFL